MIKYQGSMKKNATLLITCFALAFTSCKKEPGEGGFATIQGKLYVKDYNQFFTLINGEYYAQGENVYIVYGDGPGVGNSVKTSYDGTFVFEFLRKGKYKVFAISKDSSAAFINSNKTKEVMMEVEIKEKKQKVVLPDLVVLD